MKVIARTVGARTIGSNADRVLAAMPIPKGGTLESVQGELHVLASIEDQPVLRFYGYGFSGEMVPIVAADEAQAYQDIWEEVVVKASDLTQSSATNTLDFDWDTADTGPAIEPGEVDIDALLGMGQGQKTIIPPRMEWVSWAKNRQGGFTAGTPDDWQPSDYKTFRSKRRLKAEGPSAALLALSSPVFDDIRTSGAHLSPNGEARWYMLQNMADTMRELGKFQAGLSEIGADRPGEDASAIVEELIASPMLDESTTLYENISWNALCVATWVIDYPGSSIPNTLDGR